MDKFTEVWREITRKDQVVSRLFIFAYYSMMAALVLSLLNR